jgi:hypothetical protein
MQPLEYSSNLVSIQIIMLFIGGKQSSSESESDVSLVTESSADPAILQEPMENAVSFPAAPGNITKETNSLLENQEPKRKKRAKESKPLAMPQWLPDEVRFLGCRFFGLSLNTAA